MNNTKLVRLLAEEVMECYLPDGSYLDITKHGVVMEGHNNRYWDPLENWNDCMMLVEQMVKDRFGLRLEFNEHILSNFAYFIRADWDNINKVHEISQGSSSSHKDMKEAICIAIAKAREIEYE